MASSGKDSITSFSVCCGLNLNGDHGEATSYGNFGLLCPTETSGRVRIQCHGKNISGFYFHLSQNMSSLVEVFCRNGNQVFVWGWRNLVIGGIRD
jgi:hypothetical protein